MVPLKQAGNESSISYRVKYWQFPSISQLRKNVTFTENPQLKIVRNKNNDIKRLKWVLLWIEHDTLLKEMYLVPLKSKILFFLA